MVDYALTCSVDAVTYLGELVQSGSAEWDAYQVWLAEGNQPDPYVAPGTPVTFEDYARQFTAGLQAWMEGTAQSNAYDSVLSCVSYKDSGVAQFAGDAAAMVAWRDALWRWAAAYQSGANGQLPDPMPTLEALIAMAPQPAAYGWVVHEQGKVIEALLPPTQTS